MGYGLIVILTPVNIIQPDNSFGPGLCTTIPHPDLSPLQAVALEYIATTVLILFCCGVWDPRNAKNQDGIPVKFGLTITALGLIVVNNIYSVSK